MKVQIIDQYGDFLKLRDSWNQLLEKSSNKVIFLTLEWLSAWWDIYGKGHKLFVILVKEGENILAAAPLMITKDKKLQFIAHDISDYMDFIVVGQAEECFKLIFDEINRGQHLWDWAEFVYLAEGSPFMEEWKKHVSQIKAIHNSIKKDCVSIVLDLNKSGKNWADLEKTLPKKRRNDLRRCPKLLQEKGKLTFKRIRDFAEIESQFDHFISNYKRRWQAEGMGSQFDDPLKVSHYLNIARKLSPNGWVELATMKLNDEYLAMAFGYIYNGRYYYYTPTFNPDYSRYSPGNLLIKCLIESFYQEGQVKTFDLLRGAETYKYVWSKEELVLYRIRIYPRKVRSAVLFLTNSIVSAVLPQLQKIPVLRRVKHALSHVIKR